MPPRPSHVRPLGPITYNHVLPSPEVQSECLSASVLGEPQMPSELPFSSAQIRTLQILLELLRDIVEVQLRRIHLRHDIA